MSWNDFDNDELRAMAGIILLVLGTVYIIAGADNTSIEYLLMGLAGFLVGAVLLPPKNGTKT